MDTAASGRLSYFPGQTNADLAAWAVELRAALRSANEDKKALREWAMEVNN